MAWEAPHKKPLWIDPEQRGKVNPITFERCPTEFWYPYVPVTQEHATKMFVDAEKRETLYELMRNQLQHMKDIP